MAIREQSENIAEKPQTAAEYNSDLEKGDLEIGNGEFTTVTDLKAESTKAFLIASSPIGFE